MKYVLTCNDAYNAMVREDITVEAEDLDEAFEKARKRFCRRHRTKAEYVDITAVKTLP